eukprot:GEMP01004045.1.p1 GENE.GEMP01004045.1~~GEMP01004045.1.p1  ORF type:complete len:891 (+),score=261.78 GEMP01004045.1:466-3138(+)
MIPLVITASLWTGVVLRTLLNPSGASYNETRSDPSICPQIVPSNVLAEAQRLAQAQMLEEGCGKIKDQCDDAAVLHAQVMTASEEKLGELRDVIRTHGEQAQQPDEAFMRQKEALIRAEDDVRSAKMQKEGVERRNIELEQSIEALKLSLHESETKNDALRGDIELLTKELTEKSSEGSRGHEELVTDHATEVNAIKEMLAKSDHMVEEAAQDKMVIQQELDASKVTNEASAAEVQSLTKELAQERQKNEEVQKAHKQMKVNLHQERATSETRVAALTKDLEQREEAHKSHTIVAEKEELQRQFDASETKNNALILQADSLTLRLANCEQKRAEEEDKVEALNTKLVNLVPAEAAHVDAESGKLPPPLANVEDFGWMMIAFASTLVLLRWMYTSSIKALKKEIRRLGDHNTELTESAGRLGVAARESARKMQHKAQETHSMRRTVGKTTKQLVELESSSASMETKNIDLRANEARLNNEMIALREKNESERAELITQLKEKEETIKEKGRCLGMGDATDEMKRLQEAFGRERDELTIKNRVLERSVAALESEVKDATTTAVTASEKAATMRQRSEKLTTNCLMREQALKYAALRTADNLSVRERLNQTDKMLLNEYLNTQRVLDRLKNSGGPAVVKYLNNLGTSLAKARSNIVHHSKELDDEERELDAISIRASETFDNVSGSVCFQAWKAAFVGSSQPTAGKASPGRPRRIVLTDEDPKQSESSQVAAKSIPAKTEDTTSSPQVPAKSATAKPVDAASPGKTWIASLVPRIFLGEDEPKKLSMRDAAVTRSVRTPQRAMGNRTESPRTGSPQAVLSLHPRKMVAPSSPAPRVGKKAPESITPRGVDSDTPSSAKRAPTTAKKNVTGSGLEGTVEWCARKRRDVGDLTPR